MFICINLLTTDVLVQKGIKELVLLQMDLYHYISIYAYYLWYHMYRDPFICIQLSFALLGISFTFMYVYAYTRTYLHINTNYVNANI
jgi:hypothetical protein